MHFLECVLITIYYKQNITIYYYILLYITILLYYYILLYTISKILQYHPKYHPKTFSKACDIDEFVSKFEQKLNI